MRILNKFVRQIFGYKWEKNSMSKLRSILINKLSFKIMNSLANDSVIVRYDVKRKLIIFIIANIEDKMDFSSWPLCGWISWSKKRKKRDWSYTKMWLKVLELVIQSSGRQVQDEHVRDKVPVTVSVFFFWWDNPSYLSNVTFNCNWIML